MQGMFLLPFIFLFSRIFLCSSLCLPLSPTPYPLLCPSQQWTDQRIISGKFGLLFTLSLINLNGLIFNDKLMVHACPGNRVCVCVFQRLCTGVYLQAQESVCLISKFFCVTVMCVLYVRYNLFFSETDFWLSAAVAPAKLLSPHILCIHSSCVSVRQA